MAAPHTAKPATVSSEPALKIEQLGGPLNSTSSKTLSDIQASRLSRLYALTFSTASTIATLAFGVAR
jgi:hypothetical protein